MDFDLVLDILEKYMVIGLVVITLVSLFAPSIFNFLSVDLINYFLIIIMFCMGLTLTVDDFKIILKNPKDLGIGCLSQFLIMPLLAFIIGILLNLDAALFVGLVIVGTCPGGTASNVMSYLADGDVALSVGMTSLNTLIAPIITPVITYLLLRTTVNVNIISMFLSIIGIVILPIALGLIINKYFEVKVNKIKKFLPSISIIGIMFIIAIVISHNSAKILSSGLVILTSVILLNLFGYLFGYLFAKVMGLSVKKCKTISIETGMQNSGLATSLAKSNFPNLAMATVPGAIFSVFHNITGFILARVFKKFIINDDEDKNSK